ncbi:MAG: DUF655 domain-containing protein [Fervidicoccaceae archaeon]
MWRGLDRSEGGRGFPKRFERRPFPEDFAIVLDFLPQGNPLDRHPEHRREPLVQAIGEKHFTLMEIVTRHGEDFKPGERLYVNPEYVGRGPVRSIVAPISFEELTSVAVENLKNVIEQLVKEKEKIFVEIFNVSEPLTLKMHALELIPGIGKKCLGAILEERRIRRFESFEDLEKRLSMRGIRLQDPSKLIAERILIELRGGQRHYLFVRPREGERDARYLGYLRRLYSLGERAER